MSRAASRSLLLISSLLASGYAPVALASASNLFISQSGTGAGSSCSDSLSVTWFDTAGNWGSGATQIGPGTTVHLCGTFTSPAGASNYLTTQASGTSTAPITILFEKGANLSAPYWGGAAISVANDDITINGGVDGLIQATANGTGLTYQNGGGSCVASVLANDFLVENLTCANIYVHTCTPPIANCIDDTSNGAGFFAFGGSNVQFTNNTIHDTHWAYEWGSHGGDETNVQLGPGNVAYHVDHGLVIAIGNGTTGTLTGAYVYGNHVYDLDTWDDVGDDNHHDGVHVFDFANDTISQVYVYDNLIDGSWGMHNNAAIYMESADEGGTITSCAVFNNVMNPSDGGATSSGAIADYTNDGCLDVNNDSFTQGLGAEFTATGGAVFYNDIIENSSIGLQGGDNGKISASDDNDFYDLIGDNQFIVPGGVCCLDDLAGWQSATGFDMHSITSDPSLTAGYVPNAGSPVIKAGKNLYSLCNLQPNPGLGALCQDAAGSPRSATLAWDIGAYQFNAGTSTGSTSTAGGTTGASATSGSTGAHGTTGASATSATASGATTSAGTSSAGTTSGAVTSTSSTTSQSTSTGATSAATASSAGSSSTAGSAGRSSSSGTTGASTGQSSVNSDGGQSAVVDGGCGCSSSSEPSGGLVFGLALLAVRARRRRL